MASLGGLVNAYRRNFARECRAEECGSEASERESLPLAYGLLTAASIPGNALADHAKLINFGKATNRCHLQ